MLMEGERFPAHTFPKNQILSQTQILRLQVEGAFILSKRLPMATKKVLPEPRLPQPGHLAAPWLRVLSRDPRLALSYQLPSGLAWSPPAR